MYQPSTVAITKAVTITMGLFLLGPSLFFFTLAALPVTLGVQADANAIRIALVGDSTVADYKPEDSMRGWGQLFPELIDVKRATVRNFAVNGRSTKTFKNEGRWETVLAFKPHYIFIQFGHNDSHAPGRPESTAAKTDYSNYLREYIATARAQGATPILITPMHRGRWAEDGSRLTQELRPYADAVRQVAREQSAPLVDLYASSEYAFEQMGDEGLKRIFAAPDTDRTHFNVIGARLLAWLVAEETARVVPALKTYWQSPSSAGSSPAAAATRNFAQWEKEIAAYEQMDRTNPPPQGALLFIGSSTIRLWKTLAEDFSKHRVINRGFGGSQIVDATHFAERIIFPYAPRVIFLRAGGNDIHAGKSPAEVFADFKAFVAKIQARLPQTEIVFIGLSPSIARWSETEQTKMLNTMVKEYVARTPRLKYIETYDTVLGADGQPRPELFVEDKLHFNAAGYKLLAERVRPYLPK